MEGISVRLSFVYLDNHSSVWMSGSPESCKQQHPGPSNGPIPNIWIITSDHRYLHLNLVLISLLVISVLSILWTNVNVQVRSGEPADVSTNMTPPWSMEAALQYGLHLPLNWRYWLIMNTDLKICKIRKSHCKDPNGVVLLSVRSVHNFKSCLNSRKLWLTMYPVTLAHSKTWLQQIRKQWASCCENAEITTAGKW